MNILSEILKAFSPGASGFVFMWVLAGVAGLALVVIVERWIDISRRTNVDAERLTDRLRALIREGNYEDAYRICAAAGRRALPRIIGAGIRRARETPALVRSAMEEESLHLIPALEKRLNLILMFGNISTLLGLMGTIFGLILSFDAVAQPDVAAVEKSSMLASGISTAMNTTLLGLSISIPCVLIFSILRSRVDHAVQEIDRYSVAVLKVLMPENMVQKGYKVSGRRIQEEVDTEPNIAPMMNLMVILIPLLLSSAEFIKIGAIELKLPESAAGGGGGGEASDEKKDAKLDLGVVVTAKGFNLFHYYEEQQEEEAAPEEEQETADQPRIPKVGGEYDFQRLNKELAEVKEKVLRDLLATAYPSVPEGASLIQLYRKYTQTDLGALEMFKDHESVKIVAEDTIRYETVVGVMDAARGVDTPHGKVTMFPEVSLAGGIVR
jgi:biopolymer transport protein ExbB/TolQ/biopolymer transport protein ExbD